MPRHGVGARLNGLLVAVVMRVGRQRAALAGFEIHHVGAALARLVQQLGAMQQQGRLARLLQQRQQAGIGGLGAADGLEHQIHWRAASDRL